MRGLLLLFLACSSATRTPPPPEGWANVAPARVWVATDLGDRQLLEVEEAQWRFFALVPDIGAAPGDFVLLGKGVERFDVAVPGRAERLASVVEISHVAVVDEQTARASIAMGAPADAVPVAQLFAERAARDGQQVRVYGAIVKASHGIVGTNWYHLQDGSGDAAVGDHDLMVQSETRFELGQRLSLRGRVKADADLGFGYEYVVMLQDAALAP